MKSNPKVMATHNHGELELSLEARQLKPLFRINPLRHAAAMAGNWAIILMTIILCIRFFNPALYVLAVLIIGARMHALAILMHDATHYRFLKNRRWNDLITNLTTMYPIFSSIDQYRQNHLRHHQHLNTEHDPDWVAKFGKREFTFPKTKAEFVLTVLSYFTLIQGIRDTLWFLRRFGSSEKKAKTGQLDIVRLGFYVILATTLTITGSWAYFAFYWVIPYLTTFFMFQYIRSVAEHFGELDYDHPLTSTRTVRTNCLERFFLSPHNVGYHLEHHLYPGVPFYHLPKLHRLLMEETEYREMAHITRGYLSGLMQELGR